MTTATVAKAMGGRLPYSGAKRLKKLQGLLARLKRGETVQNRQLHTWLGKEGYEVFEDLCCNMVEVRKTLTSKPDDLVEYEQLLKKAILLYNRAEAASLRADQSARGLHEKAEVAFEKALRRLQEMIAQDPSLQMWLDRHCDFTAIGNLSPDPIGVPRVITSRSPDNQSGGVRALLNSKRKCKIEAVEMEIERIINPPAQSDEDFLAEGNRQVKIMRGRLRQ